MFSNRKTEPHETTMIRSINISTDYIKSITDVVQFPQMLVLAFTLS